MANLSKEKIDKCVEKLTSTPYKVYITKKQELINAVLELYLKSIPKNILEIFNSDDSKPKDYLKTRNSISFMVSGSHKYLECQTIPSIVNSFIIPEEHSKNITKLCYEVEDLYDKYKELKKDLGAILKSLRTDKRVLDEFPELSDILKKDMHNLPLIPLENIKNKLKNFPE